jgi:hypothetical protein
MMNGSFLKEQQQISYSYVKNILILRSASPKEANPYKIIFDFILKEGRIKIPTDSS